MSCNVPEVKQSTTAGAEAAANDSPSPSKLISERKLQANRLNGQKSQGPKTARGKDIARWNSFRHGSFAKRLRIDAGAHVAGYEQYQALLEELIAEFPPANVADWIELNEYAMAYWRYMRAADIELQETESESFANHWFAHLLRYSDQAHRQWQHACARLQTLRQKHESQQAGMQEEVGETSGEHSVPISAPAEG